MRTEEQKKLNELVMDCKSELLNHTLQSDIVSPHIKNINSYLDRCLAILQKDSGLANTRGVWVRNTRVTGESRENVLFFAYCISKWDTEFVNSMLGRILNQTEALDYLADALNVKVTTFRNYRDTFDSHVAQVRSSRQGWKKALNDEFKFIIDKYDGKSEQELITTGKEILLNGDNKPTDSIAKCAPENVENIEESIIHNPPTIEFVPDDISMFKKELLQTKLAQRTWYFQDGGTKKELWNASNFTEMSDIKANIKTNNTYRKWKEFKIVKVRIEVVR